MAVFTSGELAMVSPIGYCFLVAPQRNRDQFCCAYHHAQSGSQDYGSPQVRRENHLNRIKWIGDRPVRVPACHREDAIIG